MVQDLHCLQSLCGCWAGCVCVCFTCFSKVGSATAVYLHPGSEHPSRVSGWWRLTCALSEPTVEKEKEQCAHACGVYAVCVRMCLFRAQLYGVE